MRRPVHGRARGAAFFAALVLALALAGDGGRAATVPATIYGQDPLEVLDLKVRPNVIVVLDSSGSMKWNLGAPGSPTNLYYPPEGGDHPRSKLWLAKQVLKKVIGDNQSKVNFLFGQYTMDPDVEMQNRPARLATSSSGKNRFQYSTFSCVGGCPPAVSSALANAPVNNGLLEAPGMATTPLGIRNDRGGSNDRGLQSWQLVYEEWKNFYYEENVAGTSAICTATMPGVAPGLPRFYRDGGPSTTAGTFAADLRAAMNGASCTPARPAVGANVYDVAYNVGSGVFTISRTAASTNSFRPLWSADATRPANIRGALNGPPTPNLGTGPFPSGTPFTLLYRAAAAATNTWNHGAGYTLGSGPPPYVTFTNTETVASTPTTIHTAMAGRFFNGETIRVQSDGQICGLTFPTATDRTNPPSFRLQEVAASCGADVAGSVATFRWGGAAYNSRTDNYITACDGFQGRVPLVPCDTPPPPMQLATIAPWLDNEFPLDANGMPHPAPADLTPGAAPGAIATGYREAMDGTWATSTFPPHYAGGLKAYGRTPIAATLEDVKTEFNKLWTSGGATMVPPNLQLDAISTHRDPKERTIVLFVTDGEDTSCFSNNTDDGALGAAYRAEVLHQRIAAAEPASSVETFIVGFGGSFSGAGAPRLNWIAWGGSGLGDTAAGQPDVPVSGGRWNPSASGTDDSNCGNGSLCQSIDSTLKTLRAGCTTCRDAFLAPDAQTLARQVQGIIDQGAQDGEFAAAQSITENVFEYVDRAGATFDARSPSTRYGAITPTRFITSFSLPGFKGQLRAYQNDGAGNAVLKWSAADKLNALVRQNFLNGTCKAGNEALVNECLFADLHGGVASDPATSAAVIKRRIYSTERNGLFDFSAASLIAGTANQRVSLWPPSTAAIVPADYATQGTLDVALGLPPDSTPALQAATEFATLQARFKACSGANPSSTPTNLPAACTNADPLVRMKAARREARELILAFAAGARPVLATGGLKRSGTSGSAAGRNQILYTYRDSVLADSELATLAVVTPPLPSEPLATPYIPEYKLFRDGARDASARNPDTAGAQIKQGFGLRSPDDDGTAAADENDTRTALKPVMTVVYAPANDMLHAFRAGPSTSPSSLCDAYATTLSSAYDCGGEELWGFVPYDQLATLGLLAANQPQGRDNHVYMLARGARFSDVFVPQALTGVSVGGVTQPTMKGVWRRVLYFGRGIGGKHVTALDVTAPGTYTAGRLQTAGPLPLWSRGNPDTRDGLATGTPNGSGADLTAYATMGQTWSVPVVAYVGGLPFYVSARASGRAGCASGSGCAVDHVLFMGSGYSETAGQGTTFYTLDALTGDVIASADVETAAANHGLSRTPKPTDQDGREYENAIVANPAGFNPKVFNPLVTVHPAAAQVSRVYVGDLYGRLWKFLTAQPNVAIPVADLGVGQPVGTSASLLGMPPQPDRPLPYVFVTSGADRRRDGPFRMFGFWDNTVEDANPADPTGTSTVCVDASAPCEAGVTAYAPVEMLFNRIYDQGEPEASCGYTEEAVFRGTVQPTTAFECSSIDAGTCNDPVGRVFFAGTRLSLPNTRFAPPTPLACGVGQYPCRSQFDSTIYALGAKTGNAAYDLNAAGDDAYRVFRDSRLTAIQMLADPDPGRGGSSLTADEGQIKGAPKPPPPPGVPPSVTSSTSNVVMARETGQPPPAIRQGSTVCQ